MHSPGFRFQTIAAGAVHVVLSAVDTHKALAHVVGACLATLALCERADVIPVAIELRSARTLLTITTRRPSDVELVYGVVDTLSKWVENAQLVNTALDLLVPFAVTTVSRNADDEALLQQVRHAAPCPATPHPAAPRSCPPRHVTSLTSPRCVCS